MSVDLLKERYELLRRLGSGGFSTVFAALDTLLDREVAVKILKASLHEDRELVNRFLLEAKLTSRLSHPNTLTVHDFGRDDHGHCFFVTELLVGESLHEELCRGPLPPLKALMVASQVCLALQEAHDKEIIHRDIKPGNIFLLHSDFDDPFIKLLDFGIAKSVGIESQTVTGQMMGTPTYMSPEQIVNIKEVDRRTDIYSLGVVVFHMICGFPPFKGESYFDTMRMHMQSPLPEIASPYLTDQTSKIIRDLLLKALAKKKSKRFNSARVFYEAIQATKRQLEGLQRETERTSLTERAGGLHQAVRPAQASIGSSAHRPPVQQGRPLPQKTVNTRKPKREEQSFSQRDILTSTVEEQTPVRSGPEPTTNPLSFLKNEPEMHLELSALLDPFDDGASARLSDVVQEDSWDGSLPTPDRSFTPEAASTSNEAYSPANQLDTQKIDGSSPFSFEDSDHSTLRVLILDVNEFAGEMYKRGLTQGAEKRKKERSESGVPMTSHLAVQVYTQEIELLEELEWGADLVLVDLKSRDGESEAAGIELLRNLEVKRPPHCHIIAICKDKTLALPAMEAGADAVLSKPVRNHQLFDAAAVYLWGLP